MMNNEERTAVYRGMIMTLACAIYNDEEGWDKGTVIGLLKMGDPESGHDNPRRSSGTVDRQRRRGRLGPHIRAGWYLTPFMAPPEASGGA